MIPTASKYAPMNVVHVIDLLALPHLECDPVGEILHEVIGAPIDPILLWLQGLGLVRLVAMLELAATLIRRSDAKYLGAG